ncbi:hypothetical protein HYV72_01755 [Candidatus Uhrbacteria bacterium]|nr:hypothetical protein [Candidatus Uhrbacteria bacterium]
MGPIHAGIIEPGHFRFSVAGEEIVLLEARLGFVHKGIEKLFERLSIEETVRLSEKISGDSSASHSLAYCQALEILGEVTVPARANYLRAIFAELERLANHFGDIGAIMIDTGFNFGGAHGARLRELVMQIHERLSGNRFLRGVNTVGGVTRDIDEDAARALTEELQHIATDFSEVVAIAENSASLLNRLKGTGTLALTLAQERGAVGVAARAVGMPVDARVEYPYAAYEALGYSEIVTQKDGDVHARFRVRIEEAHRSMELIQKALREIPSGSTRAATARVTFKKNACAVSLVEGWRGEIVYFVTTDAKGHVNRVAPRDPSWRNWGVLGEAGFGNVVPDFPLINKSFNLSYSGNDL